MAVRPNFPLPKGYFGPVGLTKEQEERYREIVRKRLQTALAEEHDFTVVRKRQVDASKWKLYKSKGQLHTYKRRTTTVVLGDAKHGSMLCIGRIEGTLEDMIYGIYDKSHEEMKVSMKYIDTTTKDCTVLHTIDLATPNDPFHYLGFKWFVTRFPGGSSLLIKDRDWPYLEATGIEKDSTGRRYGYLIMHAVNLPNVPAFDQGDVVRGQLFFTFLFREHDGGFIDIFSQGFFDPAGDVIKAFSAIMTQETLMVVSKAVKCAEAKKLTLLALACFSEKSQFNQHRCSVCTSSGGMFSSLRVCRICGATVCSKCRLKKFLFAGRNHAIVNVTCCPPCVLKAKTMSIQPAEEAFSILAEKHLPDDLFRAESSAFSDAADVPTPRDLVDDKSTVCGDSDDEGGYTMSVSSGMSEDDMEGMIEAMMKQKLGNSRTGGVPTVVGDQRSVLLEGVDQKYPSAHSTPRTHKVVYENGAAFFPPQPAGAVPMQPRSTSGHHNEFEFRNLNQPQPQPQYMQRQPQYIPPQYAHHAYGLPQQYAQSQYLHPSDVRNMPASEFVSMGQPQHSEFRNLNQQHYRQQQHQTMPSRGAVGMDYRSPNDYHPGVSAHPQYDYRGSGPSDEFRGVSSSSSQSSEIRSMNGSSVPQPMPPMAPMPPQMPSSALDYHSLSPQQVAALNARQGAMGPQPGMAPHQAELFHKMVALQNSAQQVYQITKANEEYMRNLHGSETD